MQNRINTKKQIASSHATGAMVSSKLISLT